MVWCGVVWCVVCLSVRVVVVAVCVFVSCCVLFLWRRGRRMSYDMFGVLCPSLGACSFFSPFMFLCVCVCVHSLLVCVCVCVCVFQAGDDA